MKKVFYCISIAFLQLMIIALFTGAFYFVLLFLPVIVPSVDEGKAIFLLLAIVSSMLLIQIISAIWTYRSVKKLATQGKNVEPPFLWTLIVFFIWFPGLAIYLTIRKYKYLII